MSKFRKIGQYVCRNFGVDSYYGDDPIFQQDASSLQYKTLLSFAKAQPSFICGAPEKSIQIWMNPISLCEEFVTIKKHVLDAVMGRIENAEGHAAAIDEIEPGIIELYTDSDLVLDRYEIERGIEDALYSLFCVLNLSHCGMGNFHHNTIQIEGWSVPHTLFGYYFEAGIPRRKLAHPFAPKYMDFDKVYNWYKRVRTPYSRRASSPAERSLYIIMHLATLPETHLHSYVSWIFSALESLYDTDAGNTMSTLKRRIFEFLKLDEVQTAKAKKSFNQLVGIRSSFVHGDQRIFHPMSVFDRDQDENEYSKINTAIGDGVALIMLTLQFLIEADAKGLSFEDRYSFDKL